MKRNYIIFPKTLGSFLKTVSKELSVLVISTLVEYGFTKKWNVPPEIPQRYYNTLLGYKTQIDELNY